MRIKQGRKMDKNVVKQIRNTMFNHIVGSREAYKNFSATQKIKFVWDAFNNVNTLCCELWQLNPEHNNLWFSYGESSNAFAETIGKSSFIAYSAKVAMNIQKPETVYRLLMHEMRHLYQQRELYFERDNECASYYADKDDKTHAEWAASPSEKAANAFAYLELAKILGGRIFKSEDRLTAFKAFANVAKRGTSSFFDHFSGSIRYKLDERFECFRKTSERLGAGVDDEFGGQIGFISPQRFLTVAEQNPLVFEDGQKYNAQMHQAIADSSEDGFQELFNSILLANKDNAPQIIEQHIQVGDSQVQAYIQTQEGQTQPFDEMLSKQSESGQEGVIDRLKAVEDSVKYMTTNGTVPQNFEQ